MAPACILMVIGVILVWNSGRCDARPRYEHSSEQVVDDAENDLKGTPTKSSQGGKSSLWNLNSYSRILGFKKVIPMQTDDCSKIPDCQQLTTSSTSSTTHKPVLGRDRILDQLHDHTGYKQPMYHSALDGWSFG